MLLLLFKKIFFFLGYFILFYTINDNNNQKYSFYFFLKKDKIQLFLIKVATYLIFKIIFKLNFLNILHCFLNKLNI